MKRLYIGAGPLEKKGHVHMDVNRHSGPDILHNPNKIPYPFNDSVFDTIEADHILEYTENPLDVMKELHRILKENGILIIKVPHFSRGFSCPGIKNGFDVNFSSYFNPGYKTRYAGKNYLLKKIKMRWSGQPHVKKAMPQWIFFYMNEIIGYVLNLAASLNTHLCSRIWCFWVGGFEEIEFHFICRKGDKMAKNKNLLGELWDYLKVRKAWWLTPIIIMLLLVGLLIIFGHSSSVSPFVYALF